MLKISNRTKLMASIVAKIVVTMLVGFSFIVSLILINYNFVYEVKLTGESIGFIGSKSTMQEKVENYVQYGENVENFGYVILNEKPQYILKLAKKNVTTDEEEVYAKIKESSEIYYKIYAVEVDGNEVGVAKTLNIAQEIVDGVDSKQQNYRKKAEVTISEKYETDYEAMEDVTVAVADIIKPIKETNDALVKKYTTYSAGTQVSNQAIVALKNSYADLNFKTPVNNYVITSRYGWRRNNTNYHTGLDFAVNTGTPIYAAEDGIVTCAKWSGNYGYLVKIQHANGYETYYAHCSRFKAKAGQEVKKGDVIAYVGSTGNSTGPHLHLEIRLNGKSLNPENFL